jgi:sterol desaturase/sphingolipid hydroxylase (fatty acid hydroxylase superfamily)
MQELESLKTYIPFDLFEPWLALKAYGFLFLVINFRYWVFASLAWVLLYRQSVFGRWREPIIKSLATKPQQMMEMKYSFCSSFIFAGSGLLMGCLWQKGLTRIYLDLSTWDLLYLPLSAFLLAFLHDTYFYWTHRWLHLPKIFKAFHAIHHASRETSPWTSFSFHPMESTINALALPLIVLILPLHPLVILFHLTLMTVTAVTNHVGVEVLPKSLISMDFHRHWISGYHHGQHHILYKYNYGLFFSWWDRWMCTESPDLNENIHKYVS